MAHPYPIGAGSDERADDGLPHRGLAVRHQHFAELRIAGHFAQLAIISHVEHLIDGKGHQHTLAGFIEPRPDADPARVLPRSRRADARSAWAPRRAAPCRCRHGRRALKKRTLTVVHGGLGNELAGSGLILPAKPSRTGSGGRFRAVDIGPPRRRRRPAAGTGPARRPPSGPARRASASRAAAAERVAAPDSAGGRDGGAIMRRPAEHGGRGTQSPIISDHAEAHGDGEACIRHARAPDSGWSAGGSTPPVRGIPRRSRPVPPTTGRRWC